jgi:succinyldiaminopimelate transaminase
LRKNPLVDRLATYPQVALDRRKAEVREAGLPLYDFGTGDPREPTPQFIREAVREALPEISQYPKIRGDIAFRMAASGYMKRRFGVELDPDTQVLPTSGAKEAIFHMPLMLIDPSAEDRIVVFPDPGYPGYRRGTLFAGGQPYPQALGGDFRQAPWELPAPVLAKCRLMWLNSPHNPSGALAPLADLQRSLALCQANDILLVNDECYADIYHAERPHSLLEAGIENALVLHSLSKRSGMTGYRSGFVAGDPEAIAQLALLRVNPGLVPSTPVNAGATVAWADDSHTAKRRETFAAKRCILDEFLREEDIALVASEASFYLWLKCPGGLDGETYSMWLLDHGIVLAPGAFFSVGKTAQNYVRVALVPSVEECKEAIVAWKVAHDTLREAVEEWRV